MAFESKCDDVPKETSSPRPEPIDILIVDRRALLRQALRLLLQAADRDFRVAERTSIESVRKKAAGVSSALIALIDDGVAEEFVPLVGEMVAEVAPARLLVIGMHADTPRASALLATGLHGFVPPDVDARILAEIVRHVAGGGRCTLPALELYKAAARVSEATAEIPRAQLIGRLTSRQREVLDLVALGKSNREIARALSLQENTVKVHLQHIMRRLGVRNRTRLAHLVLTG